MKRFAAFLNNNWVSGIATGLVVFGLTSGLVSRLDRTTVALSILLAVAMGFAVWMLQDNRQLRSEVETSRAMAQFNPSTGFFYWPTDTEQAHPLCPDCSSNNRIMALVRDDNRWFCPGSECRFIKYD